MSCSTLNGVLGACLPVFNQFITMSNFSWKIFEYFRFNTSQCVDGGESHKWIASRQKQISNETKTRNNNNSFFDLLDSQTFSKFTTFKREYRQPNAISHLISVLKNIKKENRTISTRDYITIAKRINITA